MSEPREWKIHNGEEEIVHGPFTGLGLTVVVPKTAYDAVVKQLAAEKERADKAEQQMFRMLAMRDEARKERDALAEKLKAAEAEIARIRRDGRDLNMRLENENIAYFNALQAITEEGHADCEYCLKHDRIASEALEKEAQK